MRSSAQELPGRLNLPTTLRHLMAQTAQCCKTCAPQTLLTLRCLMRSLERAGSPMPLQPADNPRTSDGSNDAVLQNLPSAHAPCSNKDYSDDANSDRASSGMKEGEGSNAGDDDRNLDADLIQMKTLRSTTSTHDDWLHRGPYLHDIPFHTYAEYIDLVRIPRKPPPGRQLFHFEPHYALSHS